MKLIELFKIFFFIGLTTFGGGYAMLPALTYEIAEKRKWATEEELLEYYAIGQATPGIIAINTATFIGYKVFGVIGAVVATIAFVIPSIIIISILFFVIDRLEDFHYTNKLIKLTVCGLLINTVYNLILGKLKNRYDIMFFTIAIILCYIKLPIYFIVLIMIFGGGIFYKCLR